VSENFREKTFATSSTRRAKRTRFVFPVDRFAGDRRSARWSRSRLACASTWILSLRISSRASPRLV
jgi:hypothetical protein